MAMTKAQQEENIYLQEIHEPIFQLEEIVKTDFLEYL